MKLKDYPGLKDCPRTKQGFKYCIDILNKKIVSNELVYLAAKRFFKDLEDKLYYFDFEECERVINIVEMFPHIKGSLQGQNIILSPWQIFIICNLYGLKRVKNDCRKYTRAFIDVARKNGKTTFLAALANYSLAFDFTNKGKEIYTAATKTDQARIPFDISRAQWQLRPKLRKLSGVTVFKDSIFVDRTISSYKPLSSDYKSQDGFNPSFVNIEEFHAHKNSGLWDVLDTATASRENALIIIITTAGVDSTKICYQVRSDVISIVKGVHDDPNFFGLIYTLDDGDDYTDSKNWIKSNPNLGISVREEYLESMVLKGQRSSLAMVKTMIKNFNVWQSVGSAFLKIDDVLKCTKKIKWSKFKDHRSFLGLDLSTKIDLTGLVQVYPIEKNEKPHYYVKAFGYLPEKVILSGENDSFKQWVIDGHLRQCAGKTIDHDLIKEDIIKVIEEEEVQELSFDPWNSTFFIKELVKEGGLFNEDFFIEFGQTVKNFSPVLKTLEALILERRITFDDNPVLRWCLLNICVKVDHRNNIYPRKENPKDRIDLAIALLMALGRILYHEEERASTYEERDILIF